MDWKNKHVDRESIFQARRELVLEAARSFATESLVGWQITDTADGFEARGLSASHEATAKFQIEPAMGGTKVAVKLLVERASPLGFMLFDVGGYYDRQIRKWLEGIQWRLHQSLTSASQQQSAEQGKQAIPKYNARAGSYFIGCLLAFLLLIVSIYFISAVLGLLTGYLYLPSRGAGLTLHGTVARITSAIILIALAWLLVLVLRKRKQSRFSRT